MIQGPFRTCLPLVLASASPRRQALLAAQGLCFEVAPSALPEPAPLPDESPVDYARRMALLKGRDVAARHRAKVVLSADTIVVHAGRILGKPAHRQEALAMLTGLANTWHEVVTGFCVLHAGQPVCRNMTTRVHMADNSPAMLAAYVATGDPLDKAGAYGIQGMGAFLVDEVQGSYTNVVGLPLRSVLNLLLEIGAIGVVDADQLAPAR